MKNILTRPRAVILTVFLVLVLLLTACSTGGDNPTGDNSTPGTSSAPTGTDSTGGDNSSDDTMSGTSDTATSTPDEEATTPNAAPTPNEQEPEIDAVIPVADTQNPMISEPFVYYQSSYCKYLLPERMLCIMYGYDENYDCYITAWASVNFSPTDGKIVGINEHDEKLPDFETRTAEQWYDYCLQQDLEAHPEHKNLEVEKTTVDDCPAIRLTFEVTEADGRISYTDTWAIDAPNGTIVVIPGNFGLKYSYDEYSQWITDIISTFRVI